MALMMGNMKNQGEETWLYIGRIQRGKKKVSRGDLKFAETPKRQTLSRKFQIMKSRI